MQLGLEMRLSLLLAQRREPTLRRRQNVMNLAPDWCPPSLMGICDRVGLRHGPYSILSQHGSVSASTTMTMLQPGLRFSDLNGSQSEGN